MKIPTSKVGITRRYLVDCDVCQEAVVDGADNSYGYETRAEAVAARKRHLELHESGYFE